MRDHKPILGMILGIGLILFILLTSLGKKSINKVNTINQPIPDSAVGFGYKCEWIAVKTTEQEKVANVLGLKNLSKCNWKTGIDSAYEKGIFITPAIDGWTLVCGWGLENTGLAKITLKKESFDTLKVVLKTLSNAFGEVQFFLTHRVVDTHCWIKSIKGEILRAYCISGEIGEVIICEGKPTDFEKNYHIDSSFDGQEAYYSKVGYKNATYLDEEFVMKVAGNWSIDPTQLDKRPDLFGKFGLIGER